MQMPPQFPHRHPLAASSLWQRLLLLMLAGLVLLTLLLPILRFESLYYPHYRLKFGAVAELETLGLIYKSDQRGTYAVLDANWVFHQPLAADEKIIYRLSRTDSKEASHIEMAVGEKEGLETSCLPQGCRVSLAGSIRVVEEELAEQYQLTAELHSPQRGAPFNQAQLVRQLPQSGFDLQRMALSLLATLLLCGGLLRIIAPTLRRSWWRRSVGCLLIGNLAFLSLHASFSFRLDEFLVWSQYRIAQYYLSWALMVLGWTFCVLVGRHLYMGLMFTCLFAIGLLANFAKISVYGIPLGGDDLQNLGSLLEILLDQHSWIIWAVLLSSLLLFWRLKLFGWLLRCSAVLIAFFGFSVFATQASIRVLGPNINYFHSEVNYHRDMVRRGPALYLFDLISGLVSGSSIFAYPVAPSLLQEEPSVAPAPIGAQPYDVVIVMQYEALWLGWQGGICKPAPTLRLPSGVEQFSKEIHSPTTGGMTVLAEFEMNTGLPIGILKQGVVPYYYLSDKVPGLARSALQQGYETHFIHPFKRNFWGRDKAIPALGYKHQAYEDQFATLQQKGLYTSDQAVVDHIVRLVNQSTQPQFIYAVTMQGHGPFNQQRYAQQELEGACPGLSDSNRQILNTYYTGVVDAMASLEQLVSTLQASGKRYLIVAFGDHQPYLMGAGGLVLPKGAHTEFTFRIPFMAFTSSGRASLAESYGDVRQLFQASQKTSALLRGVTPEHHPALLHPLLGMEKEFSLSDYQTQIHQTFRPELLPH
ncbi:MAG: LTA synthase family protein [Aeromonadaceae bacterium]